MKQGPQRQTILKEMHTGEVVNGETVIKVHTGQLNVAAAIQTFYKNIYFKRQCNDDLDSLKEFLEGIEQCQAQ